jgi:hypothetical protein
MLLPEAAVISFLRATFHERNWVAFGKPGIFKVSASLILTLDEEGEGASSGSVGAGSVPSFPPFQAPLREPPDK